MLSCLANQNVWKRWRNIKNPSISRVNLDMKQVQLEEIPSALRKVTWSAQGGCATARMDREKEERQRETKIWQKTKNSTKRQNLQMTKPALAVAATERLSKLRKVVRNAWLQPWDDKVSENLWVSEKNQISSSFCFLAPVETASVSPSDSSSCCLHWTSVNHSEESASVSAATSRHHQMPAKFRWHFWPELIPNLPTKPWKKNTWGTKNSVESRGN